MISETDTARVLNRIRMRQVALLLAVRQHGTLRAAAAELGMTQPAATKMLRELEAALGSRLFDRAGRSLRVTAAGQATLAHFEALRGGLETLTRSLAALREGGAGHLAVGSIMAPAPGLLTRAVLATKADLPGLTVSIAVETSDVLLDQLARGELDVAVGRLVEGFPRRDYELRPLEGEALALVVGPHHRLARKRRLALPDLAALPWILQPRGSPMRELLDAEFRRHAMDLPRELVETASILTTASLILESEHVAVLPAAVAASYARHGMLAVLPVQLSRELEPYGSIVRKGRPLSGAAQRFVQALHAEAKR